MSQAPNRLRELREEAGLTLAALGSQVGVSKQAISDFEQGEKAPSLSAAALIARVLTATLGRSETVDGIFLAGESTSLVDDSIDGHVAEPSAPAPTPDDRTPANTPSNGQTPRSGPLSASTVDKPAAGARS